MEQPKQRRRIAHSLNYSQEKTHGETNNKVLITQPDMALTMRNILDNYTLGVGDPRLGGKVPIYHGEDEEVPDLNRMDFQEIHEMNLETKERVKELQEMEKEVTDGKLPKDFKKEVPETEKLLKEIKDTLKEQKPKE